MIELSKCPNCAAEDRVTIAGKEFCMRCGTPSEDNAMISASDSQTAQAATQSSQVSKFGNAPEPQAPATYQQQTQPDMAIQSDPTQKLDQNTSAQVATSQQSPAANMATADLNQMPVSTNQLTSSTQSMTQPSSAPSTSVTQQTSAPDLVQINPNNQPSSMPSSDQNTFNSPTVESPDPQSVAIAQADSKIAELTSAASSQTSSSLPVISTLPNDQSIVSPPSAPTSAELPATASATPIQVDSSPAITTTAQQPQALDAISATQVPVSKTMPGASASMTLDKSEPGVFSDEELHALSNTTVDSPSPIAAQPLATNSQSSVASTSPNNSVDTTFVQPLSQTQPQIRPMPLPLPSANEAKVDNQPKESKSKKVLKPVGVVASIMLLFAAGYYMWRVNYPGLAFKIASSKAGINVSMPGYVPEGYSLKGNIQTNPGTVSYSLANQNSKKIAISQSKTEWDSQALAENYVSPKAENYLAVQAQGLTIYMMGSNQASWVNKGTWYRIESPDQPLTQEQVVKLATSL
jgi:hypothetical protein